MIHLPSYYEFACPVKIVCGEHALAHLPYELERLGAASALVVADAGVVAAGLLDRVRSVLAGSSCRIAALFDRTPPDSDDRVVTEVAQLFRASRCDGLVAVGGGSCLDTAKAVNLLLGQNATDLLALQGVDRLDRRGRPFIAIPTTAGTGSEVTAAAVISHGERGHKMSFTSPAVFPDVAILDPKMTVTAPPLLTAATGMDALTHAVEAYYGLQKNPVSDAFAVAAIRLLTSHLVPAVERGEDEQIRLGMANAALLAGMAFSNSMVGLVHALAHGTGSVAHVPHGVANAIFLPLGVEYNIPQRAEIIAELAPLLGITVTSSEAVDQARAAVSALRNLAAKLHALTGLPISLREAGVREADLAAIARAAINDGTLAMNPAEVSLEDALRLVHKAF